MHHSLRDPDVKCPSNMDTSHPDHGVNDARLRFNNTQRRPTGATDSDDRNHRAQDLQLLHNASTSGGAQRYAGQLHRHPNGSSNSPSSGNIISEYNAQRLQYNSNNMSGNVENSGTRSTTTRNAQSCSNMEANQLVKEFFGVTHHSNPASQSQSALTLLNNSNSAPANQQQDFRYNSYSNATTSNSSPLDTYNASSSYKAMDGYATGSSTLTDYLANIESSGIAMPRTAQHSKHVPQASHDGLHDRNYVGGMHQIHAQQTQQSYSRPTQQMNQSQNQPLYPNQSNHWNDLGVSTHGPIHDLNHMQAQEVYKNKPHKLNQINSPRLLLSRKNNNTRQIQKDQAEWTQTQQFEQNLTQPWNQNTSHDMHLNKYQQMQRDQTQQWRQLHTDRMYQLQTQQLQQNQTEQQQQQNSWSQTQKQCQPQQLQQNQTAQEQNCVAPRQQCQTQQIYQSPNQQHLATGLTPILKDLQFPTAQTLSDSQNQLETNLTPIIKGNAFNQGRQRRMYQRNSSTSQGAQKELFQVGKQTRSDRCGNLQNFFVEDGANHNLDRGASWTGEQKENLPACQADKVLMVSFDISNNVLAFELASDKRLQSTDQEHERNKTSSEFNIGARTAAAFDSSSFLLQSGATLNSGLPIQDLLSAEKQADQIIFDNTAVTASCANGLPIPKTFKDTYACEICGNVFQSRSSLRAHRLRHLDPTKRYGCTTCDSKFSDRSSLRKHLRVHTGEQPFECKTCGSRFSQAGKKNSFDT